MLQGHGKVSEEAVAELETLREGSKELHGEVAKLKFTLQQKVHALTPLPRKVHTAYLLRNLQGGPCARRMSSTGS